MADIMTYDKELTAIQTWLKSTTGLNSWKLKEAPSQLAKPVIIWDTPSRGRSWDMNRYEYVVPVNQYGRLCVGSVEDAIKYQGQLLIDLGEKCNRLSVIDNGQVIRKLKNVQIEFYGEELESKFTVSYEVPYYRTKPAEAPHATKVTNKIIIS
jgi:hypothetical protein